MKHEAEAALSSWMVVALCLTMKSTPNWPLATEPSVHSEILRCAVVAADV